MDPSSEDLSEWSGNALSFSKSYSGELAEKLDDRMSYFFRNKLWWRVVLGALTEIFHSRRPLVSRASQRTGRTACAYALLIGTGRLHARERKRELPQPQAASLPCQAASGRYRWQRGWNRARGWYSLVRKAELVKTRSPESCYCTCVYGEISFLLTFQ